MGRKRIHGVHLPPGVQIIRKGSKTYYYFQPKRGTPSAGKRIPLGDPLHPDFWKRLRSAQGMPAEEGGTFAALIKEYLASPEWTRLRPKTQYNYTHHFNRILKAAGDRNVRDLRRQDVYTLRDALMETPTAANKLISVLKMLVEWSIQRGYRDDNPVQAVKTLKVDEQGATPWSEDSYAYVIENGPEDLKRLAFLGRATGQRETDLIAMSPAHLEVDGIRLKISKLRDKEHFVPLTKAQMNEIQSWNVTDLEVFVQHPKGGRHTTETLKARWNRWKSTQDALQGIKLTIHGLRATAVCDRRMAGAPDGSIADEIGMSVAMVSRYSRFADKAAAARASRDRREKQGQIIALPVRKEERG